MITIEICESNMEFCVAIEARFNLSPNEQSSTALTPKALSHVLWYFVHFGQAIVTRVLMLNFWNFLC